MAKTLPISEVKTHLPELVTGVPEREEEVVVTRKGKPGAGQPLRRELKGHWKYRVRRYRAVYQVARRVVRVIAVGHRRTIYEELGERLRSEPG